MDSRVKLRQPVSVPKSLGRQVGVLPVGTRPHGQRRTSELNRTTSSGSDTRLDEDKKQPKVSSAGSTSSSRYSLTQESPPSSNRSASGTAKVTRSTQNTNSARNQSNSSKSVPGGSKPKYNPVSSRTSAGSTRVPGDSSRGSASSSRASAAEIRHSAGQGKRNVLAAGTDCDISDEEIDMGQIPGQDVKFTNVPGTRSRPSSSSRPGSKVHRKSSAVHQLDEPGKKPYKTVDPAEILSQNMVTDFYKVYEINLHACDITSIDNMEQFRKVKVLDFSCNFIEEIDNLEFNRDLRELKLYDNRIRKIENLDNLKETSSLQLQHNKIKTIGKGLQCLKKLKTLRIDCNRLLKIETPEIASCVQLTTLDISYNMLDSLAALNYLPNLEELIAGGNRLRVVSDLSKCRRLHEVDLAGNRLTDVSGLKGLPNLQILNISSNNLSTLKTLGKLKSLQDLHVGNNRLHEMSAFSSQFPKLEVLDIPDNEISEWDEVCTLEDLDELVELFLSGNPFSAQDGQMPHYFSAIQTVLPNLQIIDGAYIKRQVTKNAPVMRPMTASSVVSLRQMDSQMRTAAAEMQALEKSVEEKFQALRQTCDGLPLESPRNPFGLTESPDQGLSTPAISRCNSRSRIKDAQAFASSVDMA